MNLSSVLIAIIIIICSVVLCSESEFDIEAFRTENQGKLKQKPIISDYGKGCAYTCKNGATPTPKKNYKHWADGCGIDGNINGLKWDDNQFRFKACCNEHDLCYGICNKPKENCDKAFSNCMNKWCENNHKSDLYQECISRAKQIFSTTKLFACGMFMEAQKQSCECNKPLKANSAVEKPGLKDQNITSNQKDEL